MRGATHSSESVPFPNIPLATARGEPDATAVTCTMLLGTSIAATFIKEEEFVPLVFPFLADLTSLLVKVQ